MNIGTTVGQEITIITQSTPGRALSPSPPPNPKRIKQGVVIVALIEVIV